MSCWQCTDKCTDLKVKMNGHKKMVRLMRNMLEIQKGVDMKKWKYSERRYEFGCEDDLIHETRKG